MNCLRFSLLWLMTAAWLCSAGDAAFAQTAEDSIQQDKIELLFQLSAYIKFSQAPKEEKLIIGVLGKDPFDGFNNNGLPVNHLTEMARASNAARAINMRRRIEILQFASADKYQRCHLLFVSSESAMNSVADTPEARLAAALKIANREKSDAPVLVVSDSKDFAKLGSPVNFYLETAGNGSIGVRTELNPDAARQSGFDKINAQYYERILGGKGRVVR